MSNMTNAEERQLRIMQKMQGLIKNDPELASLLPVPDVTNSIRTPALSLYETMDRAFDGYANRPAVGTRDYDIVISEETGKSRKVYKPCFKTLTYGQLQNRIQAVANAWSRDAIHGVKPDQCVCIFGFNGIEFAILDYATAYAHAINVPLQPGTAHMDVDEIFDSIKPVTVAVTVNDLVSICQYVAGKAYIRSLVVFDYDERAERDCEAFAAAREILASGGVAAAIISLQELELIGCSSQWQYPDRHPAGEERITSIVHSSGSTGKAKAALVTEKSIRYNWTSMPDNSPPIISLCLAPFSHLLGKGMLTSVLRQGGTAYFTLAPDMSTLFDDIRISRPTFVGFFPRILELIYQHYLNEVARRLRESNEDEEYVRQRVKQEMGAGYLGDRLCAALFGGSLISPAVKDFFVDCFDVQLLDAYGSTEGGQVAINGRVQRPPVTDYKLRDVPELGYYTTDRPYPRGEFCFKSIQSISGYHNAPEATDHLFDEDGFICTGDIVEEYEANHIAVIDRRNDVLKLSQGEYVAVGTLGTFFEGGSDVIDQIFVYGNSQQSFLLAVVVPDMSIVAARLGDNPDEQALNTLVRNELQRVARQEGIRSFEVPRDFIIELEPFSETNGLLSGLRKKIRPALHRKYAKRLELMYEALEEAKREKRRELADSSSSLTTLDKLIRLLEVDLNIKVTDSSTTASFQEMGGDSLGAVLFSLSIEEIFNVVVPADMILSPTGNLHKWAAHIQQVLSGATDRPTFATIHGKGMDRICASELVLEKFIEPKILVSAAELPEVAGEIRTVLLTGANGFLGRFVCLQWLEKLAPIGGKLVCLVRAADKASARVRLDRVFTGLDTELNSRYQELARNCLEVIAGEVGEERMGLGESDYHRLSMEVDRVVHVAALVNHRFSYANLFGANVVGVAEMIQFSLTARKKCIDFVSTAAVYPLLETDDTCSEDSPLAQSVALSNDYAAGYGASKWAGEHLLLQAHQHCGISVNVFRGDMMLPHRLYKGQINRADMFIRLLFSVIHTGIAPYSFYPSGVDGSKASGHYDGMPVDVVSAVLVGAEARHGECRIYNMENYHWDDGCSLDTFVDWIEAAGYSITRITDYQMWFSLFREKLGQLPKEDQQHSALDIVDAFATPQPTSSGFIRCDRFKALVASLPVGPELPHLSQDYINKCLEDMHLLGLINRSDNN